jgi:hypothetical protein
MFDMEMWGERYRGEIKEIVKKRRSRATQIWDLELELGR